MSAAVTKLPTGKLEAKLIALDLDDTLLNSERQVSAGNAHVLRACCERGIYVVLCSGRAKKSVLPFAQRIGITSHPFGRYLIAMNGCSVYDVRQEEELFVKSIAPGILVRTAEEAKKVGLLGQVYAGDRIFFEKETQWTRMDGKLCGLENVVVEGFDRFLNEGTFYKMLVAGEEATIASLQRRLAALFGESAVVFTSKPYFLEVLPPACGKGEAIEQLAGFLDIPKGMTLCFGDSMNDESMIRLCGASVAMINGDDRIKRLATFVTERTNDEDGVAHFIQQFVL